jgi:hypothetical protein
MYARALELIAHNPFLWVVSLALYGMCPQSMDSLQVLILVTLESDAPGVAAFIQDDLRCSASQARKRPMMLPWTSCDLGKCRTWTALYKNIY